MKALITTILLALSIYTQAQVKIGNNPNTIDANSLLELESTNKGFLPPRVALNSAASVAPLTGTVPSGMLVYSTGGTMADGFYYWNGDAWKLIATAQSNVVTKSANATLLKTESVVLASNDITIILPAVTSSDNGLEITVKNVGSHTDLVIVKGASGATIDEVDSIALTRFVSYSFIVSEGNWIIKGKERSAQNLLDVGEHSSWTTLEEVIEFLEEHMAGPTVVRLGRESYEISSTIVIDLDYSLTFQGISFSTSTIAAAPGLAGKPMFRCISDCYFKMLQFDATTLANYGKQPGEDAIRLVGANTYNEIKDCMFDRFYNTILDSSNAELWVFETDINNAQKNGILLHSADTGVILKVAETDFIGCNYGVSLSKGVGATLQLASGGYYNSTGSDTAIFYQPSTFTAFTSILITGNSWNNTGKFIEGFDFSRSDGRDANATLESNAGMADKKPNCYLSSTNNVAATALTSNTTWYKANWTTTSSSTCKWTIGNNRITYQPGNRRDAYITISGNISSTSSTATINIGIVKNPSGTSATSASITRYGETTLRPGVANQPFQFSTVIYLSDVGPTDYFELWCNSNVNFMNVTIQDIQWIVSTQ